MNNCRYRQTKCTTKRTNGKDTEEVCTSTCYDPDTEKWEDDPEYAPAKHSACLSDSNLDCSKCDETGHSVLKTFYESRGESFTRCTSMCITGNRCKRKAGYIITIDGIRRMGSTSRKRNSDAQEEFYCLQHAYRAYDIMLEMRSTLDQKLPLECHMDAENNCNDCDEQKKTLFEMLTGDKRQCSAICSTGQQCRRNAGYITDDSDNNEKVKLYCLQHAKIMTVEKGSFEKKEITDSN